MLTGTVYGPKLYTGTIKTQSFIAYNFLPVICTGNILTPRRPMVTLTIYTPFNNGSTFFAMKDPVSLRVIFRLVSPTLIKPLSLRIILSRFFSALYRTSLSPLLQSFHQFYIGPLLPVIIRSDKFRPNFRQFVLSMSHKLVNIL